mmetsp:Transcript_54021/g.90001  ORF Transcript_54021/g.90001 Transcript_54021/m.90001 type:complete len:214 (+) Transcript_54021:1688-2329(+)
MMISMSCKFVVKSSSSTEKQSFCIMFIPSIPWGMGISGGPVAAATVACTLSCTAVSLALSYTQSAAVAAGSVNPSVDAAKLLNQCLKGSALYPLASKTRHPLMMSRASSCNRSKVKSRLPASRSIAVKRSTSSSVVSAAAFRKTSRNSSSVSGLVLTQWITGYENLPSLKSDPYPPFFLANSSDTRSIKSSRIWKNLPISLVNSMSRPSSHLA